ncbi:hypothetical protein BGZ60DRAFT_527588 [Tricladium varicosporioides]|nr:hypothetical protein BGZ60DRAFT_527588 [Hymenoscyphus varicosporioides]
MASRRLIVCCDGTSKDSKSGNPLTNVARISRCIAAHDEDIAQVVFYMPGVATGTSTINNTYDAIVGRGISHDIREAYSFICSNFSRDSDEIVLIGFSRGAFTARAIALLISDIGILSKRGLRHLPSVFLLWKKQLQTKRPGRNLSELCEFLERESLLIRNVPIKACAVWDTVAALGPRMMRGIPQPPGQKLAFVNEELCPNIRLAVQALALDEKRRHFQPLLWKVNEQQSKDNIESRDCQEESTQKQVLRQCWFSGTHSDVGGGNVDFGLANISLAWMITQLKDAVKFDVEAICDITTDDHTEFKEVQVKEIPGEKESRYLFDVKLPIKLVRAGTVTIQTSFSSKLQAATGGIHFRTPGQYVDPPTSYNQEYIHSSVHVFREKALIGESPALRKLERRPDGCWVSKKDPSVVIPEAPSSDFERDLLATWTARKLRRMLFTVPFTNGNYQSHKERSAQLEGFPLFAILHSPDDWELLDNSTEAVPGTSYMSITVQGQIDISEPRERCSHTGLTGQIQDPQFFISFSRTLSTKLNQANPSTCTRPKKKTKYLNGQVVVPFSIDGNPTLYGSRRLDLHDGS